MIKYVYIRSEGWLRMFQNYAEVEDAEKVSEKSNQILYRLKKIFKYQNVVIYILTF